MPVFVPLNWDHTRSVFTRVAGHATSAFDESFETYLILKEDGVQNHTLTIAVKIFLNPVPTFGLPKLPYLDAGNNLFFIKPWQDGPWRKFQKEFLRACGIWNDRFWLTPPVTFSNLDVRQGARAVRPNIYCHLHVQLQNAAPGANRSIDVVNLDKPVAAAVAGVRASQLNSGSFGSHEALYDDLDTTTRTNQSTDDKGRVRRRAGYRTIVHEIGHAIGLPHIGETHKDPLCDLAVIMGDLDQALGTQTAAGIFLGGSNARVCYGHSAPASRSANVMGVGPGFELSNAQPWLNAVALHTGTKAADWTAVMRKPRPQPV